MAKNPHKAIQTLTPRQFLLCVHIQSLNLDAKCTVRTNDLRLPCQYPRILHTNSLFEIFHFEGLDIQLNLARLKHAGIELTGTRYTKLFDRIPIPPLPESFDLNIDRDLLAQTIADHLAQFRTGALKHKRKYFPYSFTSKVFDRFIKELSPYEGDRIAFEFTPFPPKKNQLLDAFLSSFQEHDPKAFERWRKKEYDFLWFPTLYTYSEDTKLEIEGFRLDPPELLKTESDHEREKPKLSARRWIYLRRRQKRKKKIVLDDPQIITSIQVEKAVRGKFTIYFNHEYEHPFQFTTNSKVGSMIYKIATSKKKHADFYTYAKEFYKVNGKEFRLFAKSTPFVHRKILVRQETGKIRFHPDLGESIFITSNYK